jgi:chromosome segregation ATPase
MNNVRQIKQLQSQLNTISADVSALKMDVSNKQKELNQKRKTIEQLKKTIESLKHNGEIKVSEHAILRYLERVKGLDVSEIEKEILTQDVLGLIEKLGGSGKYPVNEFQIVMKDYTVTTVIF